MIIRQLLSLAMLAAISQPAFAHGNGEQKPATEPYAEEKTELVKFSKCLWENVPTSTDNWLKMPKPENPNSISNFLKPEKTPHHRLWLRLVASCAGNGIEHSTTSLPYWLEDFFDAQLLADRPSKIAEDKIGSNAFACFQFLPVESGGEDIWGARFAYTFEDGFKEFSNQSRSLRDDMDPEAFQTRCQWIQNDGSLVDA